MLATIPEQADVLGCNLLVVGAHGVGFMHHWHGMGMTEELLLSSVAKHMLGQARSDVLVVMR